MFMSMDFLFNFSLNQNHTHKCEHLFNKKCSVFWDFSFWLNPQPSPPKTLHAHILGISPWISTIQVGLDASRDRLQVLFGNHCDSFLHSPRIQRTMSYYSFGHQPTYPNCSWDHHGPKKRKSHLSSCTMKVPILLRDRFHPYHQKIRDWQIEETLGHNNLSHVEVAPLFAKSDGDLAHYPFIFSFFFGGKNLSFSQKKNKKILRKKSQATWSNGISWKFSQKKLSHFEEKKAIKMTWWIWADFFLLVWISLLLVIINLGIH